MTVRTLLAAFACVWAMTSVTEAATIRQRTTYFIVRGSTLEELDQDLQRRGPLLSGTGARHPGSTEVKFDGQIDYKKTRRGCEVDTTDLSLRLNMTLPRWTPPARVDRSTLIVWRTLEADIQRHEEQHAAIAKNYLKRMEMAIRNLLPERTCEAMEAQVNSVTARYLAEHERVQLEFDAREGREMERRLRRAISRAFREYEDR